MVQFWKVRFRRNVRKEVIFRLHSCQFIARVLENMIVMKYLFKPRDVKESAEFPGDAGTII